MFVKVLMAFGYGRYLVREACSLWDSTAVEVLMTVAHSRYLTRDACSLWDSSVEVWVTFGYGRYLTLSMVLRSPAEWQSPMQLPCQEYGRR